VLARTSSNLTEGLGSREGTARTAICRPGTARTAEPTAEGAGIPRGVSRWVRTYKGVPKTSTRSDRATLLRGRDRPDEADEAGTDCGDPEGWVLAKLYFVRNFLLFSLLNSSLN
jgi:hypothetical protein